METLQYGSWETFEHNQNYPQSRFTDVNTIVAPTSLEELTEQLREIFDDDHVNVDYVKALMNSYTAKKSDWAQYAKYDQYRYTRNLVDQGNGKYNLIVLCWGEGHGSSIHDHADAHCFMKVLDGNLTETLYDWPKKKGDPMVQRQKNVYKKDETAYICDQIGLHRVENASHTDRAASLHLYCPAFELCHSFDEKTGRRHKCKVTFWSKFGQRTSLTKPESCVPEDN